MHAEPIASMRVVLVLVFRAALRANRPSWRIRCDIRLLPTDPARKVDRVFAHDSPSKTLTQAWAVQPARKNAA
jgi:hypothetical protein